MQVDYYPDSSIQDLKIATDAVSMIIGGTIMIAAGLVILENLVKEKNYY